MDYIEIVEAPNGVQVHGVKHFCLDDILSCGQCFRWDKLCDGKWSGIAYGLSRTVCQEGDTLTFEGADMAEFDRVWYNYFDLNRDYDEVMQILYTDDAMRRAWEFTPGMRVLRQEPWEALCSFILSQNNNIKRIRGLVQRLCESFGEEIEGGFAFPTAERLAALSDEDLSPVRCGFRASYVLDAARRVANGELNLLEIAKLPLADASAELQKIRGVGPKVAACALLYGLGRADSVPVDVWINRALAAFYPNGMPDQIAPVAGLGQQYLFHYVRNQAGALEL